MSCNIKTVFICSLWNNVRHSQPVSTGKQGSAVTKCRPGARKHETEGRGGEPISTKVRVFGCNDAQNKYSFGIFTCTCNLKIVKLNLLPMSEDPQ